MKDGWISLDLTHSEAMVLDGRVNVKAQEAINEMKTSLDIRDNSGLPESVARMVVEILKVARTKGKLSFSGTNIRQCPCCKREEGYYPVKRSTRFKRRGEPDHDKPKRFYAWDVDRGFVTFSGCIFIGFCDKCRPLVEPVLREKLADIRCEIPKHWEGMPHKWKYYSRRRCKSCGWEGHEGQMKMLPAIIDGMYPGGCPQCGEESHLFKSQFEILDGFDLVAV